MLFKQQSGYQDQYMEAVQIKIEECEQRVKKYASELIVDAESMKTTIRNYVATYFDEAES